MTRWGGKVILWGPRVLGILVCLFLSLFALDAFGGGTSPIQALPDVAVHLAPALILLAVVGVSWRWEWVGALVFTGLAIGYAYVSRNNPSWVLVISGPLLIVGVLFSYSWVHHGKVRADA